ncbi:sigma factor-like helix-turn-helix DNA-binding protein [Mesorhizobium sp. WSM4935]|uniref:sigma factor-like helix-turn-helix DNA-binding protein n=1 Tax=Mesorhizobium sp. WSM4935 TaxID=3038547 RepID=UPI00241565AC|nr:sigma factor-like helix-turn-helix DNA-binding protein [Mesorhizobium sp. WSM4935]MDG4875349.1 sigma factor-like helix-turn-helix DNA-binding protein [Mesorhizobium sp. WSM4935]
MAAFSASDLLRVLPQLRAFAICLADDRNIADALVDVVLVRAWNGDRHVTYNDVRLLLFNLMHREFHGYETTRTLARVPMRRAALRTCSVDSTASLLLRGLHPAEREAVVLLDACGFSEPDAAAICECDIRTVRLRASNASAKLSQSLQPERSAAKPALRLCRAS